MNKKKICIIDYGVGNLGSVAKAFRLFSDEITISEDPSAIEGADAVVLPGVGSFEAGIEGLKKRELVPTVKAFAKTGKPMMGICLGAQLLLSRGHEFGNWEGLDLISGEVVAFPKLPEGVAVPHIGWDPVYSPEDRGEHPWDGTILASLRGKPDVYFVHSFIFNPKRKDEVIALSTYGGYEFPSVLRRGNIYGCQFHPEKSGEVGLEIIKNFVSLI